MKKPIGRVYVLSNEAMPGLVKIGYTYGAVESRVSELSSATGVPIAFQIEFQAECRDPELVERKVHMSLSSKRFNTSREYFSVSIEEASNEIIKNADELIDSESYFEIKNELEKEKEKSNSLLNNLISERMSPKFWIEVPVRQWREFVELRTAERKGDKIIIWQMNSKTFEKQFSEPLSSIHKIVYNVNMRVCECLYVAYFEEEMAEGKLIREYVPPTVRFPIPFIHPYADVLDFVIKNIK